MNVDELDTFRAELLRQKIIFEAELRRQRDYFENKVASLARNLADRETDCRNLQCVVTILGKKVDALSEQVRPPTPRRAPTPTRNSSFARENTRSDIREHLSKRVSSSSCNSARRPSSSITGPTKLNRVSSISNVSRTTRTSSPMNSSLVHPHRPVLSTNASIGNSANNNSVNNADTNSAVEDNLLTVNSVQKVPSRMRITRCNSGSSSIVRVSARGTMKKRTNSSHRLNSISSLDEWWLRVHRTTKKYL